MKRYCESCRQYCDEAAMFCPHCGQYTTAVEVESIGRGYYLSAGALSVELQGYISLCGGPQIYEFRWPCVQRGIFAALFDVDFSYRWNSGPFLWAYGGASYRYLFNPVGMDVTDNHRSCLADSVGLSMYPSPS